MRSCEGGRGCSTTVEGTPSYREVVGSTPAGSWLFPSSILSNVYLNRLLEEPCGFSFKNECLALQLGSKKLSKRSLGFKRVQEFKWD